MAADDASGGEVARSLLTATAPTRRQPLPPARSPRSSAGGREAGRHHPVDELDITFMPRLADLAMTAMRRDATGKAAGHPAVA
ncbi:hypothetical protein [Streptomyces sp. MN13]